MKASAAALAAFIIAVSIAHAEPNFEDDDEIVREPRTPASSKYARFDKKNNALITFDKILFVKRQTYHSSHFYTDFIDGCSRFGGNICVLDLKTGKVTDLIPEMKDGIFGRYDLHFSAKSSRPYHRTLTSF